MVTVRLVTPAKESLALFEVELHPSRMNSTEDLLAYACERTAGGFRFDEVLEMWCLTKKGGLELASNDTFLYKLEDGPEELLGDSAYTVVLGRRQVQCHVVSHTSASITQFDFPHDWTAAQLIEEVMRRLQMPRNHVLRVNSFSKLIFDYADEDVIGGPIPVVVQVYDASVSKFNLLFTVLEEPSMRKMVSFVEDTMGFP